MKYYKLFNLIIIVTLMLLGLWLSLASLTPPVQAASAPLRLELALPAQRPQLMDSQADLSITKDNGVTTLIPGQTTLYTIIVTNNDSDDTANATVTDNFSAKLTDVAWTCSADVGASCTTLGAGDINDPAVTLVPGSSVTYLVTATVSPSATGPLVNAASVFPLDVTDSITPSNNIFTDTDTLTPEADLSILKSSNAVEVVPGTSVTYTIVVSNASGPSDIIGALVTDDFPAILSSINWTCSGSGGGGCQVPTTGSGDLSDKPVNLPVGGLATFVVTALVSPTAAAGSLINTASITVPVGASDPDPNNNSASETDTLTPKANLAISKYNGVGSLVPGQPTTYTMVVSNAGPSSITGITVADTFPVNLTGVSWSRNGGPVVSGQTCPTGPTSGNINCTINLVAGGSIIFTATGTVNPSATGWLTNTATVSSPSDPDTSDNSDTDSDNLTPQANLSITKADGVSSLIPGNGTTYTIVVSNAGPSNITGITVTDTFPANLTDVSWSRNGGPVASGQTCPNGPNSGNINCTINLAVGNSVTFTATGTVTPSATGPLVNTASISSPSDITPGNNSAIDSDNLTPQANLSITKTNGVTSLTPGNVTTYTIVVSNGGPSAANGTGVTDIFPANLTGVTWSRTGTTGSGQTCPIGPTSMALNCTINLAPSSSVTFTAAGTVNPNARGQLTNTVTLTPPAGVTNTGSSSATDVDDLEAKVDLRIAKSDSPDPVFAGNILTYALAVTNTGPSAANGVTVVDTLPSSAAITLISAIPSQGSCSGISVVTCNLGTITKNGNATISIQVRVKSSWSDTLSNTANVVGDEEDANPLNNFTTAVNTSVQVRSDLTITKLESKDPSALGEPLTYTLRITNIGPSDAPQVNVSDNMPNGIPIGSISASQGSCSGADPITCTLGSIASGATALVTIVVNPTVTGTLVNTASVSVSGNATDPNLANNSSGNISTTINYVTDLAITNTSSPNPIIQGNNLTYNLTVTNKGPSNAIGVAVANPLPGGVTFVSATPSQGSCSGTTTITCSLGNLAKNGSATIAIVVKTNPNLSGNISSTATVSGGGGLDASANNSATATTKVNILYKVYVSLVFGPPITDLFINNNTGGPLSVTVVAPGVSCSVPAGNHSFFCGSFPSGVHVVHFETVCGPGDETIIYDKGPQTSRVSCD